MNRHKPLTVTLPLACIAVFALAACDSEHEGDQRPSDRLPTVKVLTQTVRREPRVTTEEVVGTVRAKRHATLEPRLSGRITSLPVMLGQQVKAGELVARVDAAEIRARLEQAEASLEQAERDWNRISSLYEQQAATRAEYDAAQSRHRVARAMASEAKAMMNYADIVAPFDGLVTRTKPRQVARRAGRRGRRGRSTQRRPVLRSRIPPLPAVGCVGSGVSSRGSTSVEMRS